MFWSRNWFCREANLPRHWLETLDQIETLPARHIGQARNSKNTKLIKKKNTKKEDICISHSLSITKTPPCYESYKLFTSKKKHGYMAWFSYTRFKMIEFHQKNVFQSCIDYLWSVNIYEPPHPLSHLSNCYINIYKRSEYMELQITNKNWKGKRTPGLSSFASHK